MIEQHGPFGAKALTESGLPESIGERLSAWSDHGVKVLLARPTGRHAHRDGARRVWVAHARSGRCVGTTVSDLRDVTALDPRVLAGGMLPDWPDVTEPMLFVCTNGRRDQCCALQGRAVLAGCDDEAVWECSHVGGHRFAATAVMLPWGYVLGRLDGAGQLAEVVAAARRGRLVPGTVRGRSCQSPSAQAAELAVRHAADLPVIADIVAVTGAGGQGQPEAEDEVTVEVRAGPRWRVTLRRIAVPDGPESCGGEPVAGSAVQVVSIGPAETDQGI